MSEKTKWLEKYAPPGMDVGSEVMWYGGVILIATLQSLITFLSRYGEALSMLYTTRGGKRVLVEGAIMAYFQELMSGVFVLMVIACMLTLVRISYYYIYHYQGSKMMYLMKRLPDRWEVHRRCFTLPVAGAVLIGIWAMILNMLYFTIYIICTPSQCLPL